MSDDCHKLLKAVDVVNVPIDNDSVPAIINEVLVHYQEKAKHYATDDNPNKNFENGAWKLRDLMRDTIDPGLLSAVYAKILVSKQEDSVMNLLATPVSDLLDTDNGLLEVLKEHCLDVAIYHLIILSMVRKWEKENVMPS